MKTFKVPLNQIEELHQHLTRLSVNQQVALHLRFWEANSIQEIALHFEISWNSANRLIQDALVKLKTGLMKSLTIKPAKSAA